MNEIFYQTKTKFTNTGDALINKALISNLRAYGKIYANCSREIPSEFIDQLGIKKEEKIASSSELLFVKSVLMHALKNRDNVYVFSGPGDLYGNGMKLIVRNYLATIPFLFFRICGVKIVRIGRSVGPISRGLAMSEKIRCKFLTYYYVRDTKSFERCKRIGIKNVSICPDMSWLYERDKIRKINHSNIVMVNLRNSIFDDIDPNFINYTLKMCKNILFELKNHIENMKVIICYQISEDRDFSKEVFDYLKEDFDTEYYENQLYLKDIEKYYGNCIVHISNRMHSLLAGYKYGSLPIAIIDSKIHTKISATLTDCDLDRIIIDIHEGDCSGKIQYIYMNREKLLKDFFEAEKKNNSEIDNVLNDIFKV